MRVTVIDDAPVWTDGVRHSMPVPMNRFYERIARELGQVVVCGPTRRVPAEEVERGYIVDSALVQYVPRPYFESPVDFLVRAPWLLAPTCLALCRAVRKAEIVYLRLPSVVGMFSYLFIVLVRRPRIVQIKGSWDASVGERFRGPLGVMGRAVVNLFSAGDYLIGRRSTTLVHRDDHYKRVLARKNRVYRIAVSLISESDIFPREDTCQHDPIRLLYVGRISPAKGLEYLLQAVSMMREPRPLLAVVGSGPHLPRMVSLAKELGLDSRVSFDGQKEFGEPLFQAYRGSDIFILPSVTEGIPKVLFEAMASGVPIIATAVGGIPHVITDRANGLLVQPRSPAQIRDAVTRLLSDGDLRRSLIRNGYDTVRSHSLEATAGRVAEILREEVA